MDTIEIRVTHLLLASKQPEKKYYFKDEKSFINAIWRWLEKINVLGQCNYISKRNIPILYCVPHISLSET